MYPEKRMGFMVTFASPQFEDRQWAQPLLEAEGSFGCEYNFANI